MSKIVIDERYCKGCGICVHNCPKQVLSFGTQRSKPGYIMPYPASPEKCIQCRICEKLCPDFCIDVQE